MALDKIKTAMIEDDAVTAAKIPADAIGASEISMEFLSVGETAPSSPTVGQRWYRASTAITYQYTNDGTSSFWLDISSGGIGTSASRGIDFVGDVDPHKSTNLGSVGSVYYNREKNRHFVCTTATTDAQVWSGRYDAVGGTVTDYISGGTTYRIHSFLSTGTFHVEVAMNVDYLVIGGGGGGGVGSSSGYAGGGGGAGAFRTAAGFAVTAQAYTITVGHGGVGAWNASNKGVDGASSIFSSITSTGGGGGGSQNNNAGSGTSGGSGGGAGGINNATVSGGAAGTYGTAGGNLTSPTSNAGGGGGGATGAGANAATNVGGVGGAGTANYYRDGNSSGTTAGIHIFAGGGAGSTNTAAAAGGSGGGGAAGQGHPSTGSVGTVNTGSGGGGGIASGGTSVGWGGTGGSGIVVIRYALT